MAAELLDHNSIVSCVGAWIISFPGMVNVETGAARIASSI